MATLTENTDLPDIDDPAVILAVGDQLNGWISPGGDRDFVGLSVEQGQSYRVTISSSEPLRQPFFQLRDPVQGFVAWSEETEENGVESLAFEAPETGTLVLGVDMAWNRVGSYRITVEALADFDDRSWDAIADFMQTDYWQWRGQPVNPKWEGYSVTYNIEALEPEAQQLALWAFEAWNAITDLRLERSYGAADILVDDAERGGFTTLDYAAGTSEIIGARINVDYTYEQRYPGLGDFAYFSFLHEIGHALGLGHTGHYNHSADYSQDALYRNDSTAASVMSYFWPDDVVFGGSDFAFPITPMPADIIAIREMYGRRIFNDYNDTHATEFSGYNTSDGIEGVWHNILAGRASGEVGWVNTRYTIIDEGGIDIIDANGASDWVRIDLNEGATSRVSNISDGLTIMPGSVIENAGGGVYDDILIGNAVGNRMWGNDGDDSLYGADGDDKLRGGAGDDWLEGNLGADSLWSGIGDDRLDGGQGDDRLEAGAGEDTVFGGSGFDTLYGYDGNDRLVGGDGGDVVYMGTGDDLFVDNRQAGPNGADTVWGEDGNDSFGGGGGDDFFHGGAGADLLRGRNGADRLIGGGQNDTLEGGAGNDTVEGGNGADRAFMGAGDDLWRDNAQGQFGNDLVVGGQGDDTIEMGGGNDIATGGDGADMFVFATLMGDDVLTDFTLGEDKLHIAAAVWGGALDQARLDALGVETPGGPAALEFGPGHRIVLQGLDDLDGLLADIVLI